MRSVTAVRPKNSRPWILSWALAFAFAGQPVPGAPESLATFAGGCFWCMEEAFEKVPGVVSVTSGYTGGEPVSPTYQDVSDGGTGHAEAIEVRYDPSRVNYGQLLEVFWHNIDPLTPNAQFCDHGNQYRSAIFYHHDEEKRLADASKLGLLPIRAFQGADRDGDRGGGDLLPGRGIPPGLLPEESGALRVL